MNIGILSDTHGNLSATRNAARLFQEKKVGVIFLCGDIGGVDVLSVLAGDAPVHAVLGNVDIYSGDWRFFPENVGVHLHGRFGDITIKGRRIALLHGDDKERFYETVSSGKYDLVFSGHTHIVHDYTEGKTRCINPGSAGRGNPHTCAILDLGTDQLKLFEL
ncbi:MAG: metallophosphoesterase family protein [Pontiellaceae bacterium]|nr:metallophosphoesterase family protein [Pontiellaceae bacterium]